jgi:hypothetical protein
MSTPSNAAPRRSARDGRAHLTLVTDRDEPDGQADDEPQGAKHAAPRPLLMAGSATVRALMALGALLSAIGLSIGKADALRAHDQPLEEADPAEQPAPKAGLTGTGGTTKGSAGYWAPTTRPALTASYAVKAPPPTGKHRKSASTEGWGEWNPDQWERPTGRHRKSPAHGAGTGKHHHPKTPAAPHKTHKVSAVLALGTPAKLDLTPGRV